jgi:hypothetical protein
VVESQPSKLLVAGSIPVSRSRNLECAKDAVYALAKTRTQRAARLGAATYKKHPPSV